MKFARCYAKLWLMPFCRCRYTKVFLGDFLLLANPADWLSGLSARLNATTVKRATEQRSHINNIVINRCLSVCLSVGLSDAAVSVVARLFCIECSLYGRRRQAGTQQLSWQRADGRSLVAAGKRTSVQPGRVDCAPRRGFPLIPRSSRCVCFQWRSQEFATGGV